MWKHLEEFALKNWRVVREAWGAFSVWCLIVLVTTWLVCGKFLEIQITNLQSDKGTLTTRNTVLENQNRELSNQLAASRTSTSQTPKTERDPNSLYQFDEVVANAPEGKPDRPNGVVMFPRILATPNFNINAEFDYQRVRIKGCQSEHSGSLGNMGIITLQIYQGVTCQISGLRP